MASPAGSPPSPGKAPADSATTCYELREGRHCWSRCLQGVSDPASDVKVHVHDGHLLLSVRGQQIDDIVLPPNAYTGDAKATYQRGTVTVEMAAKDPNSPAMVEKNTLDPDRPNPREIPLSVTSRAGARVGMAPMKADPTGHGTTTPAQAEYGARNDEPVAADTRSADTKLVVPAADAQGGDSVQRLSDQMGRAQIAPRGTTAVEAEHPEGDDALAAGDQIARKRVDIREEKVGMATRPLEARDFAVTSKSAHNEPASSLKAQLTDPRAAAEVCDLCQCAPCQCDKMDKNFPYELTGPETKRHGKPSMPFNARKFVTAHISRAGHEYKGTGSLEDLTPEDRERLERHPVGGREICPELVADPTRAKEKAALFLG